MKKKAYIAPSLEEQAIDNIDIITESLFTEDLSYTKKKGFALNEGNIEMQVDNKGSITLK